MSAVRSEGSTPTRTTVAATVLVGASAVAVVGLLDPYDAGHYPTCPLLALTGLYCPFCGGLRAVHDLTHLDLVGALGRNPLVVLVLPAVIGGWIGWAQQAFTGRRIPGGSRHGWNVVLVVLLAFVVLRNLPGWTWLSPA